MTIYPHDAPHTARADGHGAGSAHPHAEAADARRSSPAGRGARRLLQQ